MPIPLPPFLLNIKIKRISSTIIVFQFRKSMATEIELLEEVAMVKADRSWSHVSK
jgi:hypothetical protein